MNTYYTVKRPYHNTSVWWSAPSYRTEFIRHPYHTTSILKNISCNGQSRPTVSNDFYSGKKTELSLVIRSCMLLLKLKSSSTITQAQRLSNFIKHCADVQALIEIKPQNLNKSKVHSLIYFHLTPDQFYACARPRSKRVENLHGGC